MEYRGPRTFEAADIDGVPGLVYHMQYRLQEERGAEQLVNAAGQHFARFTDVNGMVIGTRPLPVPELTWGSADLPLLPAPGRGSDEEDYVYEFRSQSARSLTGLEDWWQYTRTVAQLTQLAREWGINPVPRRKRDIVDALIRQRGSLVRETWPGWFHNGVALVLRADGGQTGRTLRDLRTAAAWGCLDVRQIGSHQLFLSELR